MRIDVLTLFPQMFDSVMGSSILNRAVDNGLIEFCAHNIRDYSDSKHKNTDDYPFGGGAGMVMMAQPIFDCMDAVLSYGSKNAKRILLTPRGRLLTPKIAEELAGQERLVLLCGHYEGIDERVYSIVDDEISIGDYVLTGGELAAMVVIDCLSRFIPGVLGCRDSAMDESFSSGLLEYPQYTRPAQFRGNSVPEVLLNGNHAKIAKWRREQALLKTKENRPDLLEKVSLTEKDKQFLKEADTKAEL